MPRLRIAALTDLEPGQTLKFEYAQEGIRREGFAAWANSTLVAYENVCRHLPLSLDYGDNRFYTPDRTRFICTSHGALYDPATGLCVRGPCEGASLKRLTVEACDGGIWVTIPEH